MHTKVSKCKSRRNNIQLHVELSGIKLWRVSLFFNHRKIYVNLFQKFQCSEALKELNSISAILSLSQKHEDIFLKTSATLHTKTIVDRCNSCERPTT